MYVESGCSEVNEICCMSRTCSVEFKLASVGADRIHGGRQSVSDTSLMSAVQKEKVSLSCKIITPEKHDEHKWSARKSVRHITHDRL